MDGKCQMFFPNEDFVIVPSHHASHSRVAEMLSYGCFDIMSSIRRSSASYLWYTADVTLAYR